MALPVVAATFIGGLISGLVQFFTTKAGHILAGLGLSFMFVKGFETILSYVVGRFTNIIGILNGGASDLGSVMLQFAAYAGFFDGLNIVISGYLAYAGLLQYKMMLARLK